MKQVDHRGLTPSFSLVSAVATIMLATTKKALFDPIAEIKDALKMEYLRDHREWMVMVSFGKDSAFLLTLILDMLMELNESDRHKAIHVVSSDTGVETFLMSRFVHQSMIRVNQLAEKEGLPVTGTVVEPEMKDRFFFQVLGKGNPPPSAKSQFRWCTHKLKQVPTQTAIKEILKQTPITMDSFGDDFDCLMLLGTRHAESAKRSASMKKHAIDNTRYHRHSDHDNILVYQPIQHLSDDELWFYLMEIETFPWGTPVQEMNIQYGSNFLECGLKAEGQGDPCGGNSRSGCWTCVIVNEDKMLKQLVEEGHWQMTYLAEWKNILLSIRNDVRYREPYQRREIKKKYKIMDAENKTDMDIFQSTMSFSAFQNEKMRLAMTVAPEDRLYQPGSITVDGRKKLLESLLWIQKQIGEGLISGVEIEAIKDEWRRDGYEVAASNICPQPFLYDGTLVMQKEYGWLKNDKETTTQTPVFTYAMETMDSYESCIEWIDNVKKQSEMAYPYLIVSDDSLDDLPYNVVIFLVCDPKVRSNEQGKITLNQWLSDGENQQFIS